MTVKRSFAPVVSENVRLLVLGSLPGDASLAKGQYYGHRQNQFWRLMSEVIQVNLTPLTYPERLDTLLARGIGLWDVVAAAHRDGSLDSNIRGRSNNDLNDLACALPKLKAVAFNGGTAARIGMRVLTNTDAKYQIVALPSSSPAYTLAYAEKLAHWQRLKPWVL